MWVVSVTCRVQAPIAMASQGTGRGGSSSSAGKGGSAQAKVTMPMHRQEPPAGYGQRIDYHGAAAAHPDEVPHMSRLQNTPKAWISIGEMLMVKWPVDFSMSTAFPPPGTADSLLELEDELAVQGASFTMRAQRKRKPTDVISYHLLRIVGPPGSAKQIYRRLRTVAGNFMHRFKGLPPVNRPRVFAVTDKGWDYDKQGFQAENLKDMDDTGAAPDVNENYSDDEYVEDNIHGQDYRRTMQHSLAVGEIDVMQSESEERTGRKAYNQYGVADIPQLVQRPLDVLLTYLLRLARQYSAAAPDCCGHIPPKQWMTEQLDAAEARGSELNEVGAFVELFVVSISANMKRKNSAWWPATYPYHA
jgi:hypothetical protein